MSKVCTRRLYAELSVDELCLLGEEDIGTIEALENEFWERQQSGVSLEQAFIADEDDDSDWCQYIQYLMEWCFSHSEPEQRFERNSPMSYGDWLDEDYRRKQQIKETRNNEACCVSDFLIGSLGKRTSEQNGDRCSMYDNLAVYNGEVFFATLIERKTGLPQAKWYYEIRFISGFDFHNGYLDNYLEFYTDTLSEEELQNLLYNLIEQIETGEYAKACAGG